MLLDNGSTLEEVKHIFYEDDGVRARGPDQVQKLIQVALAAPGLAKAKIEAEALTLSLEEVVKRGPKAEMGLLQAAYTTIKLREDAKTAAFEPAAFLALVRVGFDFTHGDLTLEEAKKTHRDDFANLNGTEIGLLNQAYLQQIESWSKTVDLAKIRKENGIEDADSLRRVLNSGEILVDGRKSPLAIPAALRALLLDDQTKQEGLVQQEAAARKQRMETDIFQNSYPSSNAMSKLFNDLFMKTIIPFFKKLFAAFIGESPDEVKPGVDGGEGGKRHPHVGSKAEAVAPPKKEADATPAAVAQPTKVASLEPPGKRLRQRLGVDWHATESGDTRVAANQGGASVSPVQSPYHQPGTGIG
jgi:hypothetical protein